MSFNKIPEFLSKLQSRTKHYFQSTWLFLHRSQPLKPFLTSTEISFRLCLQMVAELSWLVRFPPMHVYIFFFNQLKWSTVKWLSCSEILKDSISLFLSYREANGMEKRTYFSKIMSFWIFFNLLGILYILRVNRVFFKLKKCSKQKW